MQEVQASQMTETQKTSPEPDTPTTTKDIPENQLNQQKKNSVATPAQETPPDPSSSSKTPVAVTRNLMNNTYKAMASLA